MVADSVFVLIQQTELQEKKLVVSVPVLIRHFGSAEVKLPVPASVQ
jgi:hypothetical protein